MNFLKPFHPIRHDYRDRVAALIPTSFEFQVAVEDHSSLQLSFSWFEAIYAICPDEHLRDFDMRAHAVADIVSDFVPGDFQKKYVGLPIGNDLLSKITRDLQEYNLLLQKEGYASYFDVFKHIMGITPCHLPIKQES